MGHLKSLPLGAAIMGGFAKGYGDAKGVNFNSLDNLLVYAPAVGSLITAPVSVLLDRSSLIVEITGDKKSYVTGLMEGLLRLDSAYLRNRVLQSAAEHGILTFGVSAAFYGIGYFTGNNS